LKITSFIICAPHKVFLSGRLNNKAFRFAGNVARKREMTAACSVEVGKSEGKRIYARRSGLLFVFLALQPIVIVFSQPGSGL
jgi:hypothetical protein